MQSLWTIRNNDTGLFGTNMNIQSGQWISNMSGMLDKLPYNVQIGIPTQKKFGKKKSKIRPRSKRKLNISLKRKGIEKSKYY